MAWTSPRTWVAGEKPTAATLNTHIRDNLKAIGDPWTSYTPVWTATGSNPTIGNGSITGAYMQAGKLVIGKIKLTLGSTSTVGTLSYRWSLPVAAADISDYTVGSCLYNDASGSKYAATAGVISSLTIAAWQNSGAMTASNPVVPANGDIYTFEFTYEAA